MPLPSPEPLQVDAVRVVLVGTIAWFLAYAIVLIAGGSDEWRWTTLGGGILGLVSLPLMRAQRRAAARREASRG